MSPERGGMGDWMNNRRRHFDRRRGFKQRRKYFVTDGKHGTSDEDGNGCRHPFDSCYPAKTKAQDIQRRKQAVRPGWKRRAGPALESGCTSTFFFPGAMLGGFLSVCLGRSCEASFMFRLCSVFSVFPNY